MAELKRQKLVRSQCKSSMGRIESFINNPINLDEATMEALQARKERFIRSFENYERAQLEILNLDENDTEQVSSIEDKYYAVLSKINLKLSKLENASIIMQQNSQNCKLPSIELESFNGKDCTKFRPFYDLFIAVIDTNQALSNVQKLFYLRKYLEDDALAVIVNLPLVNQSYTEALELLRRRYDNKARLIFSHISVLLDLPTMQKGTAASIRSFISEVQQQLHALKNLEQPIDSWDMLLISIFTRKLDQLTNRAYQLEKASDKMPSMAEFIQILEKRALALEDSIPMKGTSYEGTYKPIKGASDEGAYKYKYKSSSRVTNVVAKVNIKCKFCNKMDNHAIYSCPLFKTAALEARQLFVRDNNLCSICLKAHRGITQFFNLNWNFKGVDLNRGFLLFVASELGVTAGAHRLWSHRSYKAKLPLEIMLMIFSTLSFQYTGFNWANQHRIHHKYTDTDADPYNSARGFFFSHIGWCFVKPHPDLVKRSNTHDMSDLLANPVLGFQQKYREVMYLIFFGILPIAIPMFLWGETFMNAYHMNFFRYIMNVHSTFLINSVAHLYGYKPYDKNIQAVQSSLVSIATLGEGFHNYHHVFPVDYRAAELGNNYFNFTTLFIDFMAWIGWAYDLKTVPEDVYKARAQRTGDGTDLWGHKLEEKSSNHKIEEFAN